MRIIIINLLFYESSPFEVILPENKIYISIKKENNEEKIFLARRDGVFALVQIIIIKKKRYLIALMRLLLLEISIVRVILIYINLIAAYGYQMMIM